MKISFMTFACETWSLEQVIKSAERYQYQGIEFRIDANHGHGVEVSTLPGERKEIRRALEHALIEPICLATSLQFATDRVIEEAGARVQLAADLGAKALRVFCGPELGTRAETIETVAQQLTLVAETTANFGIELWIETHDTFSLGRDAAAAVRRADNPSVGINYDNMHPYRMGEDLDTTFAAITGHIRHTHFHDALASPDKVVIRRIGQGELPIDDMFDRLIKSGYDGYISGEWFHDQYGLTPDDSLEAFRNDITDLALRHGVTIEND